jgi:hypothetical protein
LGSSYFDERKKESVLHGLAKRISKLKYEVGLEPGADWKLRRTSFSFDQMRFIS